MIEVNLLEEQRREIVKRDQEVNAVAKVSYGILVVVVGLFLAFQGVRLWFALRQSQVTAELASQKRVLAEYGSVEAEGLVVADKLNEIVKIIEGRDKTREKLRLIFSVFDRGSTLKQIGFGGVTDEGDLNVSGAAEGIFAYIDFDERMKGLAEEEGFEKLYLASLSRGDGGQYSFSYEITIAAPEAPPSKKGANVGK